MESFLFKKNVRLFIFRFFLIFLASQFFLWYFPPFFIQEWLAQQVSFIIHIPNNGIFFDTGKGLFEITPFCAGITSIALLTGLLFGFDYPKLKQKIILLLLGGIGLFIINIFRLAFVVWVGFSTHNLALAEQLHILTWFLMSALVLGFWHHGIKYAIFSKEKLYGKKIAEKLLEEK